jgi:hypothetical protein
MAKVSDVTQRVRNWLIWAVLVVAGVVVGQAIPQHTATPKAESGTVTAVNATATGTTFVFRPLVGTHLGTQQSLGLLNSTAWQSKPGDWHTGGLPSCLSLKPHQTHHLTLGVVTVKGTGTLPDETMVVWVKCEG